MVPMGSSPREAAQGQPPFRWAWPWAGPIKDRRRRPDPAQPLAASPGPDGAAVVAIGDVHGCFSLLDESLAPHFGSGVELIFLGDLIDRAPEPEGDRRVLRRVWQLQADPAAHGLARVTVLRGNHEQVVLDVLEELGQGQADGPFHRFWLAHGGDPALLPMVRSNREWFDSLPHYAIRGDYLFVHAGVAPAVPLERQHAHDLLWIREPFLAADDHGLPWIVVHGHSASADGVPQHLPHRIGLDTGACFGGPLTALRLPPLSSDSSDPSDSSELSDPAA